MRRGRFPVRLAAGLLALALAALAGCSDVRNGQASPAEPRPPTPDVDSLPELPDPENVPTWAEFNSTIDSVIAQAGITDHSYLDSLVENISEQDTDAPDTRLEMAIIMSSVTAVLDTPSAPEFAPNTPVSTDEVTWHSCGPSGLECGELAVPLDWDDPDGETITLALDRYPATDPTQRIGVLMGNPGGPGSSGVDFLPFWYEDLSTEIKSHFDIVSFDPRGVGQSDPITCDSAPYSDVDMSPETDEEEQDYTEEMQKMADACEDGAGDLLPYVGTPDVAQDMDAIRSALGEDQLSFVGYSYGSLIGEVYASAYPDRVRAFVLDGIMDPALSLQQLDDGQVKAFDQALRRFEDTCPKVCPGLADYVVKTAQDSPIDSPVNDVPADESVAQIGILSLLYSKGSWPDLAWALRQAAVDDDGTLLTLAADQYSGRDIFTGEFDASGDAYDAVMCRDFPTGGTPDQLFAAARKQARLYPVFASSPKLTCDLWPVDPDPVSAVTWPKDTPVLLVSTTGDPATPHSMAKAVLARNPGSRLLTHDGEGHTVYGNGLACVDDKVDAFLIDITEPPKGTVCADG